MTEPNTIEINGQPEPLSARTLAGVLSAKGLEPAARGLAIALNGAVVPRSAWLSTNVKAGDAIEIVQAKQGG